MKKTFLHCIALILSAHLKLQRGWLGGVGEIFEQIIFLWHLNFLCAVYLKISSKLSS